MIVMKFGGTSVGGAEQIRNAADIVKSYISKKPAVVVSAVTKITDRLIEAANAASQGKGNEWHEALESISKTHYGIMEKLGLDKSLIAKDIDELSKTIGKIKENKKIDSMVMDKVQSFGERMSSKIVAAQLNKIGVRAQAFNAWELGFLTTADFGNAEPLEQAYINLGKNIKKLDAVPVITGFIGKTENGMITTLGRGGSDYSAAIIGSSVNADEIQIWTDVNGILTTDPRIVNSAKTIARISFAEASELAYFGAKVLHPKTILPAMDKNIPVRVLNTFNPKHPGTTILSRAKSGRADGNGSLIKAIACKKNIALLNIASTRMLGAYGFLARLFSIFDKYKKSVDVISTSEVSVSLSVDNDKNLDNIASELREIGNVNVWRDKSIICIVGEGMRHTPGIAGRTFSALGKSQINIEMISQGASEINITFIVDGKDAEKAVHALHKEYFDGIGG